jgi:protein BCP1
MKRGREIVDNSSSDSSSEEPLVLDEGDGKETVSVDFEFFDPKTSDFWSLKNLMQNVKPPITSMFPEANLSELANVVSEQVSVGTLVKTDTAGGVLAFVSLLNLHTHDNLDFVKKLKQSILNSQSISSGDKSRFQRAFESKFAGVLVSARMVNFPDELVAKMFDSLNQDVRWAIKNEDTNELRESFMFQQIIVVTAFSESSSRASATQKKKNKRKGNASSQNTAEDTDRLFEYFEEEIFFNVS